MSIEEYTVQITQEFANLFATAQINAIVDIISVALGGCACFFFLASARMLLIRGQELKAERDLARAQLADYKASHPETPASADNK